MFKLVKFPLDKDSDEFKENTYNKDTCLLLEIKTEDNKKTENNKLIELIEYLTKYLGFKRFD